jgi:hypothetical protein
MVAKFTEIIFLQPVLGCYHFERVISPSEQILSGGNLVDYQEEN